MTDKKDQEENLKQFIQKYSIKKEGITKAPPPIAPLSSHGVILSRPPKTEPQKELPPPITGSDLMKKWSMDFAVLFHYAREGILCPYVPENFMDRVRYDFDRLTDNADERASYFSKWLYRKSVVEDFESNHKDLLKELGQSHGLYPTDPEPQHGTAPAAPVKTSAVNFLTRENRTIWHIGFEGKDIRINHFAGLQYIGYLLEKPGTSISCRELYQAAAGKTPVKIMSEGAAIGEGLNIVSSKQAIGTRKVSKICREQYQELELTLLDAGIEEREGIQEKMDVLIPYMNLKERNIPDPNDAKAQVNIGKRLDTVYAAIRDEGMTEMAEYLDGTIKPDGAFGLRYTGTLSWEITLK